ncbi:unnamed protein product [Lactuca virosa]|uniref:Regulator of chromosome condensation 1/beta-lactamase-inhibitor protein II n=1 Tax=Lactuca virosa TaxID=75947 RepID=A0AAU9PXV6_9ASTR|nr:unnamed protein product [Lactuca virosa]
MFSLFNRFAGFARLPLTPTIDVQSSTIATTISLYLQVFIEGTISFLAPEYALTGGLYAWGGGQSGQLGLGPQNGIFSCDSVTMFRNIPVLVLPFGVKQVACGHSHKLICTQDGRIHGWGYNSYGQAANQKCTYAWYPSPIDWCLGEVRKLAAGGGHSAVLTDACSLKELCEFQIADCVTPWNASMIEDVAFRTGSDALISGVTNGMVISGAEGPVSKSNTRKGIRGGSPGLASEYSAIQAHHRDNSIQGNDLRSDIRIGRVTLQRTRIPDNKDLYAEEAAAQKERERQRMLSIPSFVFFLLLLVMWQGVILPAA